MTLQSIFILLLEGVLKFHSKVSNFKVYYMLFLGHRASLFNMHADKIIIYNSETVASRMNNYTVNPGKFIVKEGSGWLHILTKQV